MGRLASAERTLWELATGSSDSHYRQALWRPTRQGVEGVALSDKYAGVSNASNWNRRSWKQLGVLQARSGALEHLLAQPNVDPAVAFTIGSRLVVGTLEDADDFGYMVSAIGSRANLAHGMRLGPNETQFGIGVVASSGQFITPPAETLTSLGPIHISTLAPGSGFSTVNFS